MNTAPLHRLLLAVLLLLAGLPLAAGAQPPPKQEFTTAEYVQLTVGWLEMTRDSWLRKNRAPTIDEQLALCKSRGVTLREYLTYPGKHGKEIEQYLAEQPQLREQLKKLNARIQEIIQSQDKQR